MSAPAEAGAVQPVKVRLEVRGSTRLVASVAVAAGDSERPRGARQQVDARGENARLQALQARSDKPAQSRLSTDVARRRLRLMGTRAISSTLPDRT